MMLLTPTMPASSVPRPTIHVSSAMPRKSPITFSKISAVAIDQTAFSSSGEMMWRAKTASRHALSTSWLGVSSCPATASMSMPLPRPNICWASDTGTTIVRSTSLNDMAVLCLRSTPTTRKWVSLSLMILPVGFCPPGNRSFQTWVPMTHDLRFCTMSTSLMKRP